MWSPEQKEAFRQRRIKQMIADLDLDAMRSQIIKLQEGVSNLDARIQGIQNTTLNMAEHVMNIQRGLAMGKYVPSEEDDSSDEEDKQEEVVVLMTRITKLEEQVRNLDAKFEKRIQDMCVEMANYIHRCFAIGKSSEEDDSSDEEDNNQNDTPLLNTIITRSKSLTLT